MDKGYCPEYAEGEILVGFIPNRYFNELIVRDLGKKLNYELIGPWIKGYSEEYYVFIYRVPKGQEEEACKKFKLENDLVGWANKRDLKLEKRWKSLDEAIDNLSSLRNYGELLDEEFKKRILAIIDALEKAK